MKGYDSKEAAELVVRTLRRMCEPLQGLPLGHGWSDMGPELDHWLGGVAIYCKPLLFGGYSVTFSMGRDRPLRRGVAVPDGLERDEVLQMASRIFVQVMAQWADLVLLGEPE